MRPPWPSAINNRQLPVCSWQHLVTTWYRHQLITFSVQLCVQHDGRSGVTVERLLRYRIQQFSNGGRPPSWIFKSLIFWLAGNLCRINICHHAKFCQNRLNGFWDITIFVFSRWPPSAILDFVILKFLVDRHIGWPYMHRRNFTKIGQTVAEISHLTIFKITAIRHLGFLKFDFLIRW